MRNIITTLEKWMDLCNSIVNYASNLKSNWKHSLLEGRSNDIFAALLQEEDTEEEDCDLVLSCEW